MAAVVNARLELCRVGTSIESFHFETRRNTVTRKKLICAIVAMMAISFASAAMADTITHGSTTINMDFVNVGNAGNTADDTGYGAVGYDYRIGTYEVTANQWAAVIAADSNVGNAGSWSGSQPTANTSWYEAAKFCNWLTTGSAATGVYSFTGSIANPTGVTINRDYRNSSGMAYFIPTEDEWYKAAYYDGNAGVYYNYPTGSNSVPDGIDSAGDTAFDAVFWDGYNQGQPNAVTNAGVASPYGTIGQGGNVWEWNETAINSSRGLRGGCWYNGSNYLASSIRVTDGSPTYEGSFIGFRVASVPEPGSLIMTAMIAVTGLLYYWRKHV
jgi:sulfatase modifying factor 1